MQRIDLEFKINFRGARYPIDEPGGEWVLGGAQSMEQAMKKFIIVDDHPAIRLAVRSALEATGCLEMVAEAEDGPAGLAVIRERKPDLVILDIELPRLSGLDLVERLRKSQVETKLLVLSAQQESIFAARAARAGANGFMSKHASMQAVVLAAQTVLGGYNMFPAPTPSTRSSHKPGAGADRLVQILSDRELTVLQYLARGMGNKEIAQALLISNKTISSYKTRVFEKLGISTVVELVDFARAHHLIS
ncbi:MAG TPA: response regulator transcription factor [Variovorax sp.]